MDWAYVWLVLTSNCWPQEPVLRCCCWPLLTGEQWWTWSVRWSADPQVISTITSWLPETVVLHTKIDNFNAQYFHEAMKYLGYHEYDPFKQNIALKKAFQCCFVFTCVCKSHGRFRILSRGRFWFVFWKFAPQLKNLSWSYRDIPNVCKRINGSCNYNIKGIELP